MFDKKINRREFLKIVVASAAAAGLSHFRFLNFGGALPVLADECESGQNPDTCNPSIGEFDICPDPPPGDGDLCAPVDGSLDECVPAMGEADECNWGKNDPDECPDGSNTDDGCVTPNPDVCDQGFGAPDICDPGNDDPDVCSIGLPPDDPDECIRPDVPDTCDPAGPPPLDPDICTPDGMPDICAIPGQDNDTTNAVALRSVRGTSSLLTTLGGVAVAVAIGASFSKSEKT